MGADPIAEKVRVEEVAAGGESPRSQAGDTSGETAGEPIISPRGAT